MMALVSAGLLLTVLIASTLPLQHAEVKNTEERSCDGPGNSQMVGEM